MFTYIAIGIALFFAMNIGASGAAATMGVAYGSGAVKKKWVALLIAATGVFLGAILGGGEVVKTLGSGIVPAHYMSISVVIIILISAVTTLFIANLIGIPLSTSEVTVGAIVGIGLAFHAIYMQPLAVILLFWLLIPAASFTLTFGTGLLIKWLQHKKSHTRDRQARKPLLICLVISCGFLEAFAAGMNNVANAVGPLVGAGLLNVQQGVFWGGLFVGAGAILLGRRVIETNGKKITNLSLIQGITVSGTSGVLIIIASIFGIPVPLTQATTTAIIGVSTAEKGFGVWQKGIVITIVKVWIVSPVLSLVIAYLLVHTILNPDYYVLVVLLSVFVSTIGVISLKHTVQKEKSVVHDEGSGI